jgi:hypothetical protein
MVESDKYPFSPRIRKLREILHKLRPEPIRKPLPPPSIARRRAVDDTADAKSEDGPPMRLGNAAAARVRLIVWCLPFGEPRLRRASRLRRVPRVPPSGQTRSRRNGRTIRPRDFPSGASGFSVPVAGVAPLIWW